MTAIVGLVESKSVYIGGNSATAGTGLKPRRRVLSALAAAERFSAGVRGPFICLKTP